MKLAFSVLLAVASLQAAKLQRAPACIAGPHIVSTAAQDWVISGAFYGRSTVPSALSPAGFYFNFPDHSTGKYIGYLMTGTCGIYGSGFLTLTMTVITTGTPTFMYDSESTNTCIAPATVRPYFETGGTGEFDRWWSNPVAYKMAAGQITVTVPLTPDQWSSLYGKAGNYDSAAMAGFINAQQHTQSIGFTFGGGCFFGHGVDVKGGTAQFQLLNYSVF